MRAEINPKNLPSDDAPGPRKVLSLLRRGSPLASPEKQLQVLGALELTNSDGTRAEFDATLAAHNWPELKPATLEIFQMNLGKLCNMTCKHCHVDAGPDRSDAVMDRATVDACLKALDSSGAHTVDLTGGAPEMNPHFAYLVDALVTRGVHILDRCNLTILLAAGYTHLPAWLAERGVEVVCSLPHYRLRNTDAQRGDGTFGKSLKALRILNEVGYGQGDPRLKLTLVSNPAGAFLAGNQNSMERKWRRELERNHNLTFDSLITLNNMPIARYLDWLQESDNLQEYAETLLNAFNPATIDGLMCRNTISVGWDGQVYDCDFNQMLAIGSQGTAHISDFEQQGFANRAIRTARHCYGCTAGAGSSCGGSLTE
ncbi:MAG: arsenosugar biosynthesis radical SAM protein ArsS [Candidatus Krumholzibacteria bacterium]|nr:arsenosugar biosynthesis radical SAM protein ArsS [Candidatus Krumholzibacteria bacterium]